MAVEIANQDKRKEELVKTFQKYDREQIMFQNCALRMLMDQQDIIHNKNETPTNRFKTTKYKNNRRTRKKMERTKQTEETKTKFHNPLPSMQREDI